jgi:hypothetical protein
MVVRFTGSDPQSWLIKDREYVVLAVEMHPDRPMFIRSGVPPHGPTTIASVTASLPRRKDRPDGT